MLETLYRGLTHLARPAVIRLLDRRAARGKEDPARRHERLGRPALPRPDGPLVWLHAASVGESLAALPLVERLLRLGQGVRVMVTTGTVTSAALMEKRLPPGAFHQFVPVDLPGAVGHFLDHWRPDLVLWVESEFWPNLLGAVRDRGIACALVNARLSERSFRSWRRVPGAAARLLSAFTIALAQSEETALRLRALGLGDVRAVGNLKYSADPLPAAAADLVALGAAIDRRPAYVFASTHPGEEEVAAEAHARIGLPGLLTILVPRHPARGEEVAALLRERGLNVARRSGGEVPGPATDVYLADTLGELGLFYRLAPVAVLGGSFVAIGGHNPIEPALLGTAVIHGPRMENFAEVTAELAAAGGTIAVADGPALADAVRALLTDPDRRSALAAAAKAVAVANAAAVDRVMDALSPLLARAGLIPGDAG
ncbi:MAG: 3-deoxy-D-manno-octulosonic-acid transferase [Pseudomonadota bacterium]|jgi:3-deoxy-D-manno-octulosonic-acid transferase